MGEKKMERNLTNLVTHQDRPVLIWRISAILFRVNCDGTDGRTYRLTKLRMPFVKLTTTYSVGAWWVNEPSPAKHGLEKGNVTFSTNFMNRKPLIHFPTLG